MRIGVSILTHHGHNLWNNGIGQNVYHLARLFDGIPFVEKVFLLDCGDQAAPPGASGEAGARFPLIPLHDAGDAIDVAIEMSGAFDIEWCDRFRARGGRIAFHNCGQPYSALVEPTLFGKPGCFSGAERCDEVWLLPKDRQFTAMMRGIHRCPVYEVPYLWASDFLLATTRDNAGHAFGYRRGSLSDGKLIPAIFEPNTSPIKMGVIPFMICEEVERRQAQTIAQVQFLNSGHLSNHQTFAFLVANSDLHKAGKLAIYVRDYFAHVMARGANMVVSHQIDVPQNYLYLDALLGGYPLIHNSPLFADLGYYYPSSDTDAGAEAVLRACREHDRQLGDYRRRAKGVIAALSPDHPGNRDAYARRLIGISANGGGRRAA
jgi:hypothetical protein